MTNHQFESHFNSAYCRLFNHETGQSIPDHRRCQEYDTERRGDKDLNPKFTTMRCFADLDYTCHLSYFMPCTPNYEYDGPWGTIIEGEEESCPENFTYVFVHIVT